MASMPSGREIHSLKPFAPPVLENSIIENMKAPPDRADDFESDTSEEEKEDKAPAGAFPGTQSDYASGTNYY
jgi:hypothetical protein